MGRRTNKETDMLPTFMKWTLRVGLGSVLLFTLPLFPLAVTDSSAGQAVDKGVALMIAEPQGEGVTSSLSGIDYNVEGTRIGVGNHRLEVFPYVEHCGTTGSDHLCGVRFEISTEGKRQPALTYGVVGNGKTKEAALKHAVQSWWGEFTVALIASLAGKNLDFGQSPIVVYPGAMAIRGTPPGGWLDGSKEMHGRIVPALKPVVRDRPPTKVISLLLIISPD